MLKLMKICVSCFLLFSVANVTAEQNAYKAKDKDKNAFLAPHLLSWGATSKQTSHCGDSHHQSAGAINQETNFILGQCPSLSSVNLFYVSTAIIHYAAANILPSRYSRMINDSSVNFQFGVYKNYSSMQMSMAF